MDVGTKRPKKFLLVTAVLTVVAFLYLVVWGPQAVDQAKRYFDTAPYAVCIFLVWPVFGFCLGFTVLSLIKGMLPEASLPDNGKQQRRTTPGRRRALLVALAALVVAVLSWLVIALTGFGVLHSTPAIYLTDRLLDFAPVFYTLAGAAVAAVW